MPDRIRILIVEDHAPSADRLSFLLEREGLIQTRVARTLAEGLAASNAWHPDVTLLDLLLPDAPDWRTTVAAIGKFYPPVIVVSDLVCSEIRAAAIAAGAETAFRKDTVVSVIAILLKAVAAAAARRERAILAENGTR